jgi:hypothetical protein
MDGADWLRTQLTSFGCASCGQAYEAGRIRVLAERDGLYFVDLACHHCDTQAIAIITVQIGDDDDPRADAGELPFIQLESADAPDGPVVAKAPVITADDVIDVHQFLTEFSGDTRDLLRLWGQELGAAGPAEESRATHEADGQAGPAEE